MTSRASLPCRRRAALLWAALVVVFVGAFAPPPLRAQDKLRLLVWINGDKGYNGLQKVGDAFQRDSGVEVVVEHPESAPDKFAAAAGAGKGPDIFCWPHDRVGEWAKSGLIVPIHPRAAVRDAIEPSAWNAFTYQGKIWGYPLSIETIGLIYNKALVSTPPASFEDVIALDRELVKRGKKAILWDYNKSFFTWPMLAGGGGYVFGRGPDDEYNTDDVGVNTPGAVVGAQMLDRLVRTGVMPVGAKYSEMESGFNHGDVAMMISGPWAWDNVKRSGIDFGVAPIPSTAGHPAKPFVGVLGCMVVAPSQVKDLAREFLENYVLKVEYLKTINADVPLGVPANKAFYRELAADPHIRATMENARRGEAIPNVPDTTRFFFAMDAALEAITNGRQSPRDALDGAAARIRSR